MGKKILSVLCISLVLLLSTACSDTASSDEEGNEKKEFTISETAKVNDTEIKINSVKKIKSECISELNGSCVIENTPDNDFYLVFDLTITNNGDEDLSVSSLISFDLKDSSGEQGKYAFLTNAISSQLDATIMPNDLLKGQVAYDVKESETYSFYYKDSLIDDSIKFVIKNSDITE